MYRNDFRSLALLVLPGLLCDSRVFSGLIAVFPGRQVVDGFYAGANRIEAMAEALLNRPAVDDLLGTIRCPTVAIVGELDEWSPRLSTNRLRPRSPARACVSFRRRVT